MGSTLAIERGLRVGELAEAVGATSDTIRYYERADLLPPPRRTSDGYRAYDVLAVDRLRFIQGAQRLGLRLADIRDLLSVRDTGSYACGPAEDLLTQRLAEVDAEIARLSALRHEMLTMLDGLTGADCPPPAPGTWFPPSEGEVKPMALHVMTHAATTARPRPAAPAAANNPPGGADAPYPAPGRTDYAIPALRSGVGQEERAPSATSPMAGLVALSSPAPYGRGNPAHL